MLHEMKDALQREIDALEWFHQIDFGDGIRSRGGIHADKIRRVERSIFEPINVAGKSVLDIGCWDGAYSIAASRRGAARVLATDHFVWAEGIGDRRTIELARKHLAPNLEIMDIPAEQITDTAVGQFDIVLFLGVFYHLRHPFLVLERIASIAKEVLVVESRITQQFNPRPVMQFHPGNTLANDPTNWWTPNRACLEALLADLGFTRIQFSRPDRRFRRGMFHAWR